MENKLKGLIKIQAPLIFLEIISVVAVFMFGIMFYAYFILLNRADTYKPRKMEILSFKNSSMNETKSVEAFAVGKIDGETKYCSIYLRDLDSLGNTLYVWSSPETSSAILRKKDEIIFDETPYRNSNILIILFVFIPTIIVWVWERRISRKIRKLKEQ